MVEKIELITGKKIKTDEQPFPTNFLDKLAYQADLTDIMKLINWKPKTSITEGLEQTINWYNQMHKNE